MNYKPIFNRVSEEVGVPAEVVKAAYLNFWDFIKKTISSLPLKEELTEEEFKELRCNFNIPSLGKLCCTYDRYIRLRNKYLAKLKRKRDD